MAQMLNMITLMISSWIRRMTTKSQECLRSPLTSPQEWRWTQSPKKLTLMYKMDSNRSLKKRPTSQEPRADQPSSPPKRPCRTLHLLAKEWQQGMPG